MLLLVWVALWVPRLTGPINFRWDASAYYILGTALAEGKGYRLLNEPGEIEAVQYPPLLPMIVAAEQRIMGTSDYFKVGCALRLTYFVLSGLFLLMAYGVARKLLSPLYSLFVGTITALSICTFLDPSDVLYADLPFAVATMGFLLCQQVISRPVFGVASGLFGAAAYLLRTAGLALLLTWVADSLIRRRFGQAFVRAAVAGLPVLLWQFHIWRVTSSHDYRHPRYSYQRADYYYSNVTYSENSRLVDPFRPELGHIQSRDLGARLMRNILSVPTALGESAILPLAAVQSLLTIAPQKLHAPFLANFRTLGWVAFCGALFTAGLVAMTGAVLLATRRHWFLSLCFGINLAIIVMTPWQNQFWRYLGPMTPLTMAFVVITLTASRDWLGRHWLSGNSFLAASVTIVPLAAIILVQTAAALHLLRTMDPINYYDAAGQERVFKIYDYGKGFHALDPAFEWIRLNAPATAVIGTSVPHLAYLRTGHKAVLPPFERDPKAASYLLDEVPVSYLVLDEFGLPGISEGYATPAVRQRPQDWRLVFAVPDDPTRVYERTR